MQNGDGDVEKMRLEYDHRRKYVVDALRGMGLECFEPRGAFYIFPCIKSTGMTSEEFCEKFLLEKKVAVIPGTAFGQGGEGFVRMSYCNSVANLTEALNRMKDFIGEIKK
jgi:aminotransferase